MNTCFATSSPCIRFSHVTSYHTWSSLTKVLSCPCVSYFISLWCSFGLRSYSPECSNRIWCYFVFWQQQFQQPNSMENGKVWSSSDRSERVRSSHSPRYLKLPRFSLVQLLGIPCVFTQLTSPILTVSISLSLGLLTGVPCSDIFEARGCSTPSSGFQWAKS